MERTAGTETGRRSTPARRRFRSGKDRDVQAGSTPGQAGPDQGADTAQGPALDLHHHAELPALRAVRRQVAAWADEHGIGEDELLDLQLAVGEAVSNAIEHGYRDRPTGTVQVELRIVPAPADARAGADPDAAAPTRAVTALVRDQGRWRPAPSRPGDRGRGITMIQNLSQDARVTSRSRGTEVTFMVLLHD